MNPTRERKDTPIIALVEVARRLAINQVFAKGVAVGLGITLHPIGNALAITERDFQRIKRHLEKTTYPIGTRMGRQLAAAAS